MSQDFAVIPTPPVESNEWLDGLLAARKPGRALDQVFYKSPAIFELEMKNIFFQHWLFVDHASRIPNKGDYFVFEIGGESIIVARGGNGEINAFFNVCRHRGSRVCLEAEGNAKRFVCPYHAWAYDLDGSLARTRHMPEDFDKSVYGLKRAHIRLIEGLIFIFLGDNPTPDIEEMAESVQPFLADHNWPEAKVCKRLRYVIHANWKLVAENALECYHCAPAHPEFASVMSYVGAMDSKRLADQRDSLTQQWEEKCKSLGHKIGGSTFRPGVWWRINRLPIREGYLTQSQEGKPVAPLMGSYKAYDGGITGLQFYPMDFLVGASDHATLNRFLPIDADRTEMEVTWLVRKDAEEGRDFDPEKVSWLWRVTGESDVQICEDNQKGVNSRRYEAGPYSQMETHLDDFIQCYLDQLRNGVNYNASDKQ